MAEELIRVANCDNKDRIGDVVFLHGLGGDGRGTWTDGNTNVFWPEELGKELSDVGIWSLSYEASPSGWLGHAMPIVDRALNVLDTLSVNGIGEKPIVFIMHSLGGLVAKSVVRQAIDSGNRDYKGIAQNTRGFVFFATPHTGADLPKLTDYLKNLATALRITDPVKEMAANSAMLRELNFWYRDNVPQRGYDTFIYREAYNTYGVRVVDETASDIGIPGIRPIPFDADHLTICKIANPQDSRFLRVIKFVRESLTRNPS